jgi:hypothetical protein
MTKSPDPCRINKKSIVERISGVMTENYGDYELDGFRLNKEQEATLHNAYNAIMAGGGWGNIRLDFKNSQLVFIKCETVQMVGSRGLDEY